jgi:hypothetical protein
LIRQSRFKRTVSGKHILESWGLRLPHARFLVTLAFAASFLLLEGKYISAVDKVAVEASDAAFQKSVRVAN